MSLVACASVAEALAALREAPVQLLLTDLMMPGENGLDLLQHLVDEPALRGGALQVVFSAGLGAAAQERLAGVRHLAAALEARVGTETGRLRARGPVVAPGGVG